MKKEVLLRDDWGRGPAGAIRAGPLLFLSACEGHRDPDTGQIVPTLAGDGTAQSRNAYTRMGAILHQCGASLQSVVRRDHFLSSMEWFAQAKPVRDEFFGSPSSLTSTAVAAKLPGINMISATAIAAAPGAGKSVVIMGPEQATWGIAAVVRVGPLLFVSGVRGLQDPITGVAAPEETPEAFGIQMRNCLTRVRTYLEQCGAGLDRVVRFDTYLRDINRGNEYRQIRQEMFGGEAPVASTGVGVLLGGRGEVEVTTVAVVPGEKKDFIWGPMGRTFAAAVQAGGYIFCSGTVGLRSSSGAEGPQAIAGNKALQTRNTLDSISDSLAAFGAKLSDVVRLDVFLRDVYFADDLLSILRDRFQGDVPTVTVAGAELHGTAEIEISAIAVQPDG